jgi:hypothetical protein
MLQRKDEIWYPEELPLLSTLTGVLNFVAHSLGKGAQPLLKFVSLAYHPPVEDSRPGYHQATGGGEIERLRITLYATGSK